MEKIGWTYTFAILSIIIGWFLNELGQWFRSRKEDKKIIKKVLYHLLETFYIFNQLNTTQLIQLITDRILLRIPEQQRNQFKAEFETIYPLIIKEFIQNDVTDQLNKIADAYSKSVDNLSTVDPIRAYRLNGKTKILQTFELFQSSYKLVTNNFSDGSKENQEQIQSQFNSVLDILKPEIINEAIHDLEIEIVEISFSINIPTWIKSKNSIKRTKNKLKAEGVERIDKWLDKFEKK
jgi:hypothetical protein